MYPKYKKNWCLPSGSLPFSGLVIFTSVNFLENLAEQIYLSKSVTFFHGNDKGTSGLGVVLSSSRRSCECER